MQPKIDQQTADLIRQLRREKGTPLKILAWQFGLKKSTVSMIVTGRTWRQELDLPATSPLAPRRQ